MPVSAQGYALCLNAHRWATLQSRFLLHRPEYAVVQATIAEKCSIHVLNIPWSWGWHPHLYTHMDVIIIFIFVSEVPIKGTPLFHSPHSYLSPPSKFSWPGKWGQGCLNNHNLILISASYPVASSSLHPEFPKCLSPEFVPLKTMVEKICGVFCTYHLNSLWLLLIICLFFKICLLFCPHLIWFRLKLLINPYSPGTVETSSSLRM